MSSQPRIKAYLYSAISSTFCFVILREVGIIGQRNNPRYGDQSLRSFGAPILRGNSNSKFLNDAIISRGMKRKNFANEAMISMKAKVAKVRPKTIDETAAAGLEASSTARLRGPQRRGGGKSSPQYQDTIGEENDGTEYDNEDHPFRSDRRSSSRASSGRTAKATRASRGRKNSRDSKSSTGSREEESYQEATGSEEIAGENDSESGTGSYSSRKKVRSRGKMVNEGNEGETADKADRRNNRYKRSESEPDNANAEGDNTEWTTDSKYAKSHNRNTHDSYSKSSVVDEGNEEETADKADRRNNRYKTRTETEPDNANAEGENTEWTTDSKFAKSHNRNKQDSYSKSSNGDNDAEGDYDEGFDNGSRRGANPRGDRNSKPSKSDGENERDGHENEGETTDRRGADNSESTTPDEADGMGENEKGASNIRFGKSKPKPENDYTYPPEANGDENRTEDGANDAATEQGSRKHGRTTEADIETDTTNGGETDSSLESKDNSQGSNELPQSGEADQSSPTTLSSAKVDESTPKEGKTPLLELDKPRIYTFFTGVQDRKANTGMTDDADDQLLQTWKEEWSDAGWKPVILTLETAKKHPDFDAVNAMLDGPFGEYDRYCFLRWLALAVVGGGFAVDYDTLPFRFVMDTLPNGGKLTVHENSDVGGVPSLVSASAEEYTKFAWDLAENLGSHKTESHWSDMKAMQDMYQKSNGKAYIMESNVMSALEVLNGRGYDPYNCGILKGKYAIHFSHHAIKFGKLWEGVGPEDRASIGREWLKGWRKSCKWRVSSELS